MSRLVHAAGRVQKEGTNVTRPDEGNREAIRAVKTGTATPAQQRAVAAQQKTIDRAGTDKGYTR